MRQLDWSTIQETAHQAWRVFIDSLDTPALSSSGVLRVGRLGYPYNYRDIVDFFDTYDIEYVIESETPELFQANVADYEVDVYHTSRGFESRQQAEEWAIQTAFQLLEERLNKLWN